jgi:hypothetical protein
MSNLTTLPNPKLSAKDLAPVFLPPISLPRHVREHLKREALAEQRDLTKQVRKVLIDYVNDARKPE